MVCAGALAKDTDFLNESIKNNGKLPSDLDLWPFLLSLIANFASPDAYLRDELSYQLIARLLLDNRLTMDQCEEILRIATDDEHLFYRIGESGTDSVFIRSFSALLVPLVVANKNQSGLLAEDVVRSVTDSVLRYAHAERDWRGYILGKGWAHSVAHTADALMACALHRAVQSDRVSRVLQAIRTLAMVPHPLAYLEDDRLAFAAFSIINKGIVLDYQVQQWLDSFQLLEDANNDNDETLCGANGEHFLRSLYFRFLHANRTSPWLTKIESSLARFDIYQL